MDDEQKSKIEQDSIITQDLAKKIFEIISILDDNPQRVIGAVAIALGYSCAIYNCDLERPKNIVDVYYKKMKSMFDEMSKFSDELVVEKTPVSTKNNIN